VGNPIVRTVNAVELEASRVRREATDLSKIERRHHRTMGLFNAGKMTIESIFGVGVVLLGDYLVIRGSSAGTVLTLYLLYTQFAAPLREIHRMRDEANEATIHVRQAFEILTIRSIHTSFGRRLARMQRTSRLNCETLESNIVAE
jgi:ABC-type bacteriocin/lantibiotic exporter with double-glycine peptidase domain